MLTDEPAKITMWLCLQAGQFMGKVASSKNGNWELTPMGTVTLDPLGTWYPRTRPPNLWPLTSIAFSSTNAMLTFPAKELQESTESLNQSSVVSITGHER